jgi:hypothetical protein
MKASKNIKVAGWTLLQFGIFSMGLGLIISQWFAIKISYEGIPVTNYGPLISSVIAAIGCGILAVLLFMKNIVGYWLTIIIVAIFALFQILRLIHVLQITLPYAHGRMMMGDVSIVALQTIVTVGAAILIAKMLLPKNVRLEFKKEK